jgi:hypothetical protein
MKALILNNQIIQTEQVDFPVADPLYWANCSPEVTTEWTFEGGVFLPPVVPEPVIPSVVSMRQARLALLQGGLLEAVNMAVSVGGEADRITWEYATEVRREDALVQNLAVGLGLSEVQLDQLFTLASSL